MAEYELTDEEAELINFVRGYDEDGREIPNGMRLTVESRGGRCLVETRRGFNGPTLIGEGRDFSSAWIEQCDGELRFALPDEVMEDNAESSEVPRTRPRLQLIKGGRDSPHE